MRVVVDTNILVSAIMKSASVPAVALRLVLRDDTLLKSTETEEELRRVLARPRFAPYIGSSLPDWLNQTMTVAENVAITECLAACRDPMDDKFLEWAVNGRADLLLSGDDDLLSMKSFRDIPIISPAAFVSARRP